MRRFADSAGVHYAGLATGVSGDGNVVIGNIHLGGITETFLWTAETGTMLLRELLERIGVDTGGLGAARMLLLSCRHLGRWALGPSSDHRGPGGRLVDFDWTRL